MSLFHDAWVSKASLLLVCQEKCVFLSLVVYCMMLQKFAGCFEEALVFSEASSSAQASLDAA